MFLLRFEVGDQFWLIGEGICKSSLTVLPSAEIGEYMVILNPDRRRDLDVLD
jgi:hypothetical protein